MTKKRFTLDETFMITDNECMEIINPLMNSKDVGTVCELLNEQHETIERLKDNIDELLSVNVEEELVKKNEQLKQSNSQFAKVNHEGVKKVQKLSKENEQLKTELLDIEEDRDYYKSKASSLEEGYIQLQDREIRLKKENNELKLMIQQDEFAKKEGFK